MFSEASIKLAKPCIEAIKILAEKARKCSLCNGMGKVYQAINAAHQTITVDCEKCKGTGKVGKKWEWKPKPNDSFYCPVREKVFSAYHVDHTNGRYFLRYYDTKWVGNEHHIVEPYQVIFFPHWEKIGEILRNFGYTIVVDINFHFIGGKKPYAIPQDIWDNASEYKNSRVIYSCDIYTAVAGPKSRFILTAFGKDYQHSVMLALNKLAKEK